MKRVSVRYEMSSNSQIYVTCNSLKDRGKRGEQKKIFKEIMADFFSKFNGNCKKKVKNFNRLQPHEV